jgi:hypothetical protein
VPAAIGIGGAVVTGLVLATLRRRPADGPLPAAVPAAGPDPSADGRLDEALRRFDP